MLHSACSDKLTATASGVAHTRRSRSAAQAEAEPEELPPEPEAPACAPSAGQVLDVGTGRPKGTASAGHEEARAQVEQPMAIIGCTVPGGHSRCESAVQQDNSSGV